jgi:WD40 repeat protein
MGRGDGERIGHTGWTTDIVSSVAFSPDGRTLASGSLDATIKLWEVPMGKELTTFAEPVKSSVQGIHVPEELLRSAHALAHQVNSVAFSPDGQTLAAACKDGKIKLWKIPPSTGEVHPGGD